jgi:UDP-glucose 4-epimerase
MFQNKTILITGAEGYIGSHLVNKFKNTTNTIIPLVFNLPSHLEHWRSEFNLIECDITQPKDLKKIIPIIDIIIHLAALNEVHCIKDPLKALITNGYGTRNMLDAAKEIDCELFIYFSTLQVYGKELHGEINVKTPILAHNDYALTHYVAEQYCKLYASNFSMNTSVLRPSNIFGAPIDVKVDRWTLVPASFCQAALENNKIILRSSGKQKRDFIDLNYIYKAVNYLINNYTKGYNIYNLSSETSFTILEIAEIVKSTVESELNKKISIVCESNFPLKSNYFRVENNLLKPPQKIEIKEALIREIKKTAFLLVDNSKQ